MQINYIKGDATEPQGDDKKILIHICNNVGGWGKGFVIPLGQKYPHSRKIFKECYNKKTLSTLGDIQIVPISDDLCIVNMIAQNGYKSPSNPVPLDYTALFNCLTKVYTLTTKINSPVSIHCPKIGSGLAGGKFSLIENMLIGIFCENNIPVNVYILDDNGSK